MRRLGRFLVLLLLFTMLPAALPQPKEAMELMKEFKNRNPDSIYLFPILHLSLIHI